MKKLIYFLIAFLTVNISIAQTENYSIATDNFQLNYNDEKYDDVFNCFSPEMKQALPLEKAKQFLVDLKTQVGKIESKEFINYQQTYANYKTKFEKAILTVKISLDNKNEINGFFISPYEEPKERVTINALDNYPKEIAEIIYSKVKDFPNNTQLSIAIIKNGDTNYYGILIDNDTIKTIENQGKVFEIGSITKVFTSSVLASLVEDKKLNLADHINAYYPFTFNDGVKISFESLANHTSGLPRLPENFEFRNNINPYKNYDSEKLDEYLKNILKLENEPTKTYSYSNLGAGLLGHTLNLSQKTSFLELLQKKIFDRYNMTNSFYSSQDLGNKLVKGLNTRGEVASNWDFDVLFGGGGILSTTEDLAKFAQAQFSPKNKELTLTRKSTFVVNEKMKVGLGWHILTSENNKELVWHNGGTGGYSSSMAVNVIDKTSVIILSNVSAFNPKMGNIDKICFELINKTDR